MRKRAILKQLFKLCSELCQFLSYVTNHITEKQSCQKRNDQVDYLYAFTLCDYVNHETTMAHWSMYTFCHTKNTTAQFFVGSLVCLQCPLPIRHSHSAHSSSPPSRVSPYGVWFGLGIAGLHRAGIKHHAGAPGMHKDHIYTNRALPVLTQSWTSV